MPDEQAVTEPFDARRFLASLTHRPGVYRMLDAGDRVLYVGKARDLKRRVSSYFGRALVHPKTQALMNQASRVEVTVTGTEQEALLLEYNLIKEHQPRFNVLLRDDKSYPYIYVSTQQEFPRFEFRRGQRKGPGRFLGPFPSAASVRQTLNELQRLFQVRQCTDAFFGNRTRPCLQHQIRRCTAPCVGLVSATDYRRDVDDALLFLEGRNDAVLAGLVERMESAAGQLEFERASRYRDQIAAIKRIQAGQVISGRQQPDTDVLAAHNEQGVCVITVLVIRAGRVLGTRDHFPRASADTGTGELLEAFIAQHYLAHPAPREILLPEPLEEQALVESALSAQASHPVRLRHRVRGLRRRWLAMAAENARQAAALRRAAGSGQTAQLKALGEALELASPPARIECFDISHSGGRETMASCVVFAVGTPLKSDYRRFVIRDIEPGDDYAAIGQAVERRYRRIVKGEGVLPDLLLIDGGRGQLARAAEVMDALGLGEVPLVAVAKGADRRAGEERLWRREATEPLRLPPSSPALHLVQQVRDEAHRFAVTGHRQRRGKAGMGSELDAIAGLGPARRRALLRHFGGLRGVRQAGVADLARVPGISQALAGRVYASLHGEEPGQPES